jgi:hypothetical protein
MIDFLKNVKTCVKIAIAILIGIKSVLEAIIEYMERQEEDNVEGTQR